MMLSSMNDGRVRLMAAKCSSCIFRPGDPMKLGADRLAELVGHNRRVGAALVCHQTLSYGTHPEVGETLCRGYYDAYGAQTTSCQVYERLGGTYELIEPQEAADGRAG